MVSVYSEMSAVISFLKLNLYCGIDCDDGENWTDVLKDEIKFFKQSMK